MTNEERKELLEREEDLFVIFESLTRSQMRFPQITEKQIKRHMELCEMYLETGRAYNAPDSPFVLKRERVTSDDRKD